VKRLRSLVTAIALALIVQQLAVGLVLFAHSLENLHEVTCDLVGAPVVVVDACRDAVFVAGWGVQ
jgi:hypothetical protein